MAKKIRPVGPDGFYSDEPEMKKKAKPKKKPARPRAGTGILARIRKQNLDRAIKESGG